MIRYDLLLRTDWYGLVCVREDPFFLLREGGRVAVSSDDRTAGLFSRYQQLAKEHALWLSLGVRARFLAVSPCACACERMRAHAPRISVSTRSCAHACTYVLARATAHPRSRAR